MHTPKLELDKGYMETRLSKIKKSGEFLLVNDEIHIPTYYPYIEVIGAVNNPGRYPFIEHKPFSYYIDLSGGLIEGSSQKFLIKSSTGQKKKLKKKQKIENSDIIFISEKPDTEKWIITKEIITSLSQIITTIVVIQRLLESN